MSASTFLKRLLENRTRLGADPAAAAATPQPPLPEQEERLASTTAAKRLIQLTKCEIAAQHAIVCGNLGTGPTGALTARVNPEVRRFLSLFPGVLATSTSANVAPAGVARPDDYMNVDENRTQTARDRNNTTDSPKRPAPCVVEPLMPRAVAMHSMWSLHQFPPHCDWNLACYRLIMDTLYPCRLCGQHVLWSDADLCPRGEITLELRQGSVVLHSRHVITNDHAHLFRVLQARSRIEFAYNSADFRSTMRAALLRGWWRVEPLALVWFSHLPSPRRSPQCITLHECDLFVPIDTDPRVFSSHQDLEDATACGFSTINSIADYELVYDFMDMYSSAILPLAVMAPDTDPVETAQWTLGQRLSRDNTDDDVDVVVSDDTRRTSNQAPRKPLPFVPCVAWSQFAPRWQ